MKLGSLRTVNGGTRVAGPLAPTPLPYKDARAKSRGGADASLSQKSGPGGCLPRLREVERCIHSWKVLRKPNEHETHARTEPPERWQ